MSDGYLKEAEELLGFALGELHEAQREHDEIRARQVCEKGYLAMLKAFHAFFLKKGVSPQELPKTDRGREFFLSRHGDKRLKRHYHQLRSSLHISGFHDAVIIFDEIEDDLNDIAGIIEMIKNGEV